MNEDPEASFKRELEIFAREADAATRFFYAYLAVHATMADREPVHDLLNGASLLWGTILDALQLSAFIACQRSNVIPAKAGTHATIHTQLAPCRGCPPPRA